MAEEGDKKKRRRKFLVVLLLAFGGGAAVWYGPWVGPGGGFDGQTPEITAQDGQSDLDDTTGAGQSADAADSPTHSNGDASAESPTTTTGASADAQDDQDAEAAQQIAPTFDVVRIEPDGLSVIAGQAGSAGTVALRLDGAVLDSATAEAGPDGRFVMMTELPPSQAVQVLGLVHTPLDTATGIVAYDRTIVSVEQILIEPATVADLQSPAVDDDTLPAASVQDADPDTPAAAAQPRLLMADETGLKVLPSAREPAHVDVVALDTISYTNQGDVALGGRGAGDGFVRVYLDNKPITTSRIDDAGYWTTALPQVDSGVYTLRVDEIKSDGSVASRVETPFKREEPADLRALIPPSDGAEPGGDLKIVTVQPGATLWALAEEKYGSGLDFVKVFEANRDRIKDPDLIYPGQVFDMPN